MPLTTNRTHDPSKFRDRYDTCLQCQSDASECDNRQSIECEYKRKWHNKAGHISLFATFYQQTAGVRIDE